MKLLIQSFNGDINTVEPFDGAQLLYGENGVKVSGIRIYDDCVLAYASDDRNTHIIENGSSLLCKNTSSFSVSLERGKP